MIGLYHTLYMKHGKTLHSGEAEEYPPPYENPRQSKGTWWIWGLLLLGVWIVGEYK
ncbi:hypothetical protein VP193E371_P0237 [Vibrio phage 193E37-1]|nr:hypothetical protein VP193E371_P0237 [Vibrio phage 193E37-1]